MSFRIYRSSCSSVGQKLRVGKRSDEILSKCVNIRLHRRAAASSESWMSFMSAVLVFFFFFLPQSSPAVSAAPKCKYAQTNHMDKDSPLNTRVIFKVDGFEHVGSDGKNLANSTVSDTLKVSGLDPWIRAASA